MISEEEARAKILETVRPLPPRRLRIDSRAPIGSGLSVLSGRRGDTDLSRGERALDCFAAEDCFAGLPLPAFDNSAMDGYAVIASDCRPGARLRVVGEQPAAVNRQLRVSSGETVRIFTGAPIPAGADAVAMQEDVTRDGDEIVVNANVEPGEFIRRRGCDVAGGQKILTKGERIRATTLALLASQGLADIVVGGEVRAGIVSTGNELAKPGEKLQPGEIYESNSVLLGGLLQRCGAIIAARAHCADNADSLREAFQAAADNQILVVTGGVSVGEHDLVQATLRSLGAKIDIWRVAIKPGKPFLFGRMADCFVFGLPGNPVSAFVTFLKFVRPAILKMMGANNLDLPKTSAKVIVDLTNESERAHYIRGKLENGKFAPIGRQESHALFGLSQSNALLRLAAGAKAEKGTTVNVEMWD